MRTRHEVEAVDAKRHVVTVRNLDTGEVFEEPYDKLILSPGARPTRPALPGTGLDRLFTLRTVEDTFAMKEFVDAEGPRSAVVCGGGFIGLEVAENLRELGLDVTIVQRPRHLMNPFDADMAALIHQEMRAHGVHLALGRSVEGFEAREDGIEVLLAGEEPLRADMVVLAIGVILSWSGAFGINLYNTLWIILIAYIARYLAFSMKSASASLQQVHYSLEDAARTCGATHFESLTDVTLPLIRPAMISGFFLIFLPAMRELTTSVLLYGPYTRTLGVAIYSLRSDGYIVDSSALASLAIVLIIICNTVVNAILKDRKKV